MLTNCIIRDENGLERVCAINPFRESPEKWQSRFRSIDEIKRGVVADHPGSEFLDFLYDLRNSDDRNTLRTYFLSPTVSFIRKWIDDGKAISFRKVERAEVQS